MMKTERMGMLAVALILLTIVLVALLRSCPSGPAGPLAPNSDLVDSAKADSVKADTGTLKIDTVAKKQKPRRPRKKREAPAQRPPRSHRDEIVN